MIKQNGTNPFLISDYYVKIVIPRLCQSICHPKLVQKNWSIDKSSKVIEGLGQIERFLIKQSHLYLARAAAL